MTDNQNDDEYQFDDLDTMGPDTDDESANFSKSMDSSLTDKSPQKKDVLRNALIVVGLIVLGLVFYKFIGSFFHKKEVPVEASTPVQAFTPPPVQQAVTTPEIVTPTPPPAQGISASDLSDITQKLSNMSSSQQSMQSDIDSIKGQLTTLTSNMSSLDDKIASLSQNISAIASRMEQQSNELSAWIARQNRPKHVRVVRHRRAVPGMVYAIQAIIPGRAWLIARNGSTLTVREGSAVPGYGTVRLIDPNQGRVVMSSGQVIRFSQQDS